MIEQKKKNQTGELDIAAMILKVFHGSDVKNMAQPTRAQAAHLLGPHLIHITYTVAYKSEVQWFSLGNNSFKFVCFALGAEEGVFCVQIGSHMHS